MDRQLGGGACGIAADVDGLTSGVEGRAPGVCLFVLAEIDGAGALGAAALGLLLALLRLAAHGTESVIVLEREAAAAVDAFFHGLLL